MSILITGMEMPTSCEKCRFFAWKRGVGQHCAVDDRITFHATLDGFDVGYERNVDCPLTHVPPHGRLIDADALRQTMYHEAFETDSPMQKWDSGCWIRYKMFENMEESAPTIIPAYDPKEE